MALCALRRGLRAVVKNVDKFKKRLRTAPKKVVDEVAVAMQRAAEATTKEMRVFNPLTDADIEINWTWGDAPPGAIKTGTFNGNSYEKMAITIYARGRHVRARWFEFGTPERYHKNGKSTGRIVAQPFFFPVYRANKKRIKSRIKAAVTRAVKKS